MLIGYYGSSTFAYTGVIFESHKGEIPRTEVIGALYEHEELNPYSSRGQLPYGHNDVVHFYIDPPPLDIKVEGYDPNRANFVLAGEDYTREVASTAVGWQKFLVTYPAKKSSQMCVICEIRVSKSSKRVITSIDCIRYQQYEKTVNKKTIDSVRCNTSGRYYGPQFCKRMHSYNHTYEWPAGYTITDAIEYLASDEFREEIADSFFGFSDCLVNKNVEVATSKKINCRSFKDRVDVLLRAEQESFSSAAKIAARNAYNAMPTFSSNGIALGLDCSNILNDVERTKQAVAMVGQDALKGLSSLYLSFHYGWELFCSDLFGLYDEVIRRYSKVMSVTALESCTYGTLRYTQYYSPFSGTDTISAILKRLDLIPDLSNVWDLVPFSFLVDWFVKIGDVAESVDNYLTMENYHRPIEHCITKNLSIPIHFPLQSNPNYKTVVHYYSRRYSAGCIIPDFSVHTGSPDTHWLEAGALGFASK